MNMLQYSMLKYGKCCRNKTKIKPGERVRKVPEGDESAILNFLVKVRQSNN